jgi:UDP-glucose 4-epimerase
MPSKRRILITGVARWWGALLVQRLIEEPDVEEVVGIDTEQPHYDLGRADFLQLDIRHSLIGKLVRAVGIDTVVHTATTIDSFDLDARRAHENNVIGTLNLLAGCAGAGSPVRRFVLKSSGHVYGSRFDLPAYLREDRRLDSGSPHAFVRDMVEVESYVLEFGVRNPDVTVVTLRFANTLNAEEPQPLARYLDLEVVPTVLGYDPILQLVHSSDCVEAMSLATLGKGSGAYNVASANPLPLATLLDRSSKLHAPLLPPVGIGLAAAALKRAGVAFLSPQLLDLLRWGRTLNTKRATRELSFQARFDTLAALEEFYRDRRVARFRPDYRAYMYEKELEDFIHSRAPAASPNGQPDAADGARPPSRPRRRPRRSPAPRR